MNKLILNTGVQEFILNNLNTDIVSVLLQKPQFEGISQKELAEQLEAKKKCEKKLPTWYHSPNIYYPNKLNIEQTSSEVTAHYKAGLVSGKNLLDLTGGFGVDSYFFSKKMERVLHCEVNQNLSEIAAHNFKILGHKNIECIPQDGIQFLREYDGSFDWIYVDPSRRDDKKGKIFLLEDCLPNLPEHLHLLFEKTKNVLVKSSPLLDITQGLNELNFVKEVHVVAVANEVKELLFVLENDYRGDVFMKTINLNPPKNDTFDFMLSEEAITEVDYGAPATYLYEPNAAILKSGGFKSVAKAFALQKLHPSSHLYTSSKLMDFPGRRFEIQRQVSYSKKSMKDLVLEKANITTRNFPISVADIRKKHKIKDGGNDYLFFTTLSNTDLVVLHCTKR